MRNRAKQKLQVGKAIIGATVGIADPDVSQWLAHMGFGSPLRWDEPHYDGAFDRIPSLLEKGHRALTVGEAYALLLRGARAAPDAARQGRGL